MTQQILRIQQKLRQRGLRVGERMSHAQILEFEHRYAVTLPDAYRTFLLEIGDGAVGPPHYGLIRLSDPISTRAKDDDVVRQSLTHLARAFPFTRPWIWEAGENSSEGTIDQVAHGALYLGTDGCGMNWSLIVTGPERGNIWWTSGEGIQPPSPGRDFLQWFEAWLDGEDDWWRAESQ